MFGLPTHLQHTADVELKQIMQRVVMLQNGVVAAQMAKSGVRGLMNYGVPLTDLRRIATETGTNHALARRLCQLNIREARILASMLFDANALDESDLTLIASSITNIDMAECFAQNIISNIADRNFFIHLANGNNWQVVAAIHAVGWAATRKTANAVELEKWFIANLGTIANLGLTETAQPLLATMRTISELSPELLKSMKTAAQNLADCETAFAKNIGRQFAECFS
jgi:3-methyladenine DNA glycosylase AlkD